MTISRFCNISANMNIFKELNVLPLVGGCAVLLLGSCGVVERFNQPISATDYNPLDRVGSKPRKVGNTVNPNTGAVVNSNDHGFSYGDIVEVVIPNTALFAKVPKSGDRYKKVLKIGTTLRVIGGKKDFIKVVTNDGVTGYVSSVMVVTKGVLTDSNSVAPAPSSVNDTWKKNNDGVSKVNSNETPIVPDVAPEPIVPGISAGDLDPVVSEPIPNITAPVPVIPDVPKVPTPEVPDLEPLVPTLPDVPAPEPVDPGLSE